MSKVTPQLNSISGLLHFALLCVRTDDADFEDVTQEDQFTLGGFIVAYRAPESSMNIVFLTVSSVSGICQTHTLRSNMLNNFAPVNSESALLMEEGTFHSTHLLMSVKSAHKHLFTIFLG